MALRALLLVLWIPFAAASGQTRGQVLPDTPPVRPAPANPQPIDNRRDSVLIALSAQVAEMRRSEDRLLTTILTALAAVVAIALLGWWSNQRIYRRDIDALRDSHLAAISEATKELRTMVEAQTGAFAKRSEDILRERFGADIMRFQAEGVSLVTIRESHLRLAINDIDGALRAARECYAAALNGNTNYVPHAFDAFVATLKHCQKTGQKPSPDEIINVRTIILSYRDLHQDPRACAVKALLDSY